MIYPLIFQKNHNDCGPACIFTLCNYYNIPYVKKEILKLAEVASNGTSIWNMQVALRALGFSCQAIYINNLFQYDYAIPIIALIKAHRMRFHYVIIYEKIDDSLVVGDPAWGIQRISIEVFLSVFTNMAIIPQL